MKKFWRSPKRDAAPASRSSVHHGRLPQCRAAAEASSPLRFLVQVLAITGAVEFVVMLLLSPETSRTSSWIAAVLDSTLLALGSGPLVWWLIIRPLRRIAVAEHAKSEAIVASAADAIITVDAHNRVSSFNPAAAHMFGYGAEEAIGKTADTLCSSGMFAHPGAPGRQGSSPGVRAEPDPFRERMEVRGRRKDGSEFPADISLNTLPGDQGAERMICARDVTDRKHAEAALLELRAAVESSGEVVFLTDREGVLTYVNPEFTRLYGYSAADVIGIATPRILKGEGMTRQDYARLWQTVTGRRTWHGELLNKTKDGRLLRIESSANAIVDDAGAIAGFLAIQRDISERKALEEQHRLARFASDNASDAIFWTGGGGEIRYANDAAVRLLGHSRPELCSMSMIDIAPLAMTGSVAKRLHDSIADGPICFETTLQKKDGTPFPADITVRYQMIDGQAAGSAIVRDLTERKRLEAEFRQAQKMDAVGLLAGGIAHDFNNLLTAILGYSELLIGCVHDNPRLKADVEEIRKAGERASRLTRQLLAFSRKQRLEPQVVDLNNVVADLTQMLSRVIGEHISLDVIAPASLGRVKVDRGQIEQVLMNLVVNARDAMPNGGRLTIATANVDLDGDFVRRHAGAAVGRYVAIRVTDTGTGMSPDVLAHAFEPFFTTKGQDKGTGLGLATVFGIVKQSDGYIIIDSRSGLGTTVTGYFPRVDAPVQAPEVEPATLDRTAGHETILLAEDDAAVREFTRRVLEERGYTVLVACNGAEAESIEASHGSRIHLLLSDVVMPELSGPDLVQRLAARRPMLKVLYISGFVQHLAGSAGGSEHAVVLQKPFTSITLSRKVRDVLDSGPILDGALPAATAG